MHPKVKELIVVYESGKEIEEMKLERPRSKSIGDSLGQKVLYTPKTDLDNVEDLEMELVKVDAHLNYYETYHKPTHVIFQEQLFNILTAIVNIDSKGSNDVSSKKKRLIKDTQRLVAILNNKLPTDSGIVRSINKIEHKNEEDDEKIRRKTIDASVTQLGISRKQQNILNDLDSNVLPSVSKLKQYYQVQSSKTPKIIEDKVQVNGNGEKHTENKEEMKFNVDNSNKDDVVLEKVSVWKLKNLYEDKSKENQQVTIPYIEGNLANIRLKRSISGNYLTYGNLLQSNVDTKIILQETNEKNEENHQENHDTETGISYTSFGTLKTREENGGDVMIKKQNVIVTEPPTSHSYTPYSELLKKKQNQIEITLEQPKETSVIFNTVEVVESPVTHSTIITHESSIQTFEMKKGVTEKFENLQKADEDIFSEVASIENVDEEFEKLVEENENVKTIS